MRSLRVFKDQWLPRPCTFKPITPDPSSDMHVSALIDPDLSGWNLEMLDQTLLPVDREIILSIPINLSGCPDSLSWHYENSGIYFVKSGFRLALSENLHAYVTKISLVRKWWSSLWNLNLPSSVRIFVWRACINVIPSGFALWKRKIVDQPVCVGCGSGVDTPEHSLFWCKKARKVWGCTQFDSFFDRLRALPVAEVLSSLLSQVSKEDMASICITLWAFWENRNTSFHGNKPRDPHDLAAWAESFLSEFHGSQRAPNGRWIPKSLPPAPPPPPPPPPPPASLPIPRSP
ncbi:hypothetical protein Dsin_009130 [Dipteronia sinensis]|uniref:Reverse transcriptase zinc-binding domain-containing protein n=1 Tax=Dipteronia sinensis TaxID=43782 RepID=A0AAE0AQX1_9ROSI|nr:hypothetical protein Dsin_009130 [Dipteronia sinensis]